MIKSIWKNRQLIATWTRYNIESDYLDTKLGFVWIALQPILMTLIYTIVFTFIFDRKPRGDVPYVIFFLSGMTLWQFFSNSLMQASNLMAAKVNLISQIKFDREALVYVLFLEKCIDFAITLTIMAVLNAAFGHYPTWGYLYLPLLLLAFFSMSLGLMFILTTVGVFIQDVPQIVSLALRLLFYFSGVLISADMLPDRIVAILNFNPMFFVIETFRNIVLYSENPNIPLLSLWLVVGLFLLFGGFSFYKKMEGKFADYR